MNERFHVDEASGSDHLPHFPKDTKLIGIPPLLMQQIIWLVLTLIAIAIAAVLIIAAQKPNTIVIQRSKVIKAPAAKLFVLVDDFKNWVKWSPFEKHDPAMKKTISGNDSGVGAVYEWEGNSKAGKGRMEIVESIPASKVGIMLDFDKPMKAHNPTTFTFEPVGDGTKVTWHMTGEQNFMMKVMCLFFSLDKMIGPDFEEGLENMRKISE